MKQLLTALACTVVLISCKDSAEKGRFTVTGELKNAPDQHVYLEELYFTEKDPAVLDTGEIKKGSFSVSAAAPEQGIYRLRLEKSEAPFIFINDRDKIPFTADYNSLALGNPSFNSPANHLLSNFISSIEGRRRSLESKSAALQQYRNAPGSDSLYKATQERFLAEEKEYEDYILRYLDTTSNAVLALFSLGYARSAEPARLEKTVRGLTARFPGNQQIAAVAAQYSQMMAQYNSKPHEGSMAPDLNMSDTSGRPFSLSKLKGKFVLVDFWASWCGPCRGENPNVVRAYNTYKDKNFTVLGVSLDHDRSSWIKAISDDKLSWYHISDLKEWNSAAVSLYGFDGIPYNVLVGPDGKILASNLRGEELHQKLAQVIQ